jgi:hypothetical protein
VRTLRGGYNTLLDRHPDKPFVLDGFFKARYGSGLRGKAATEAGTCVRIRFEMALRSAQFCDNALVKRACRACRMSTDERRASQSKARNCRATLPVWEGLIDESEKPYGRASPGCGVI